MSIQKKVSIEDETFALNFILRLSPYELKGFLPSIPCHFSVEVIKVGLFTTILWKAVVILM